MNNHVSNSNSKYEQSLTFNNLKVLDFNEQVSQQKSLASNRISKKFCPQTLLRDTYCMLLHKLGLADVDGILYPEFTQQPLPPLNEEEKKRIRDFLIQDLEINGQNGNQILNLGIKTSVKEILQMLRNKNSNSAIPEEIKNIELVGSGVFFLLGPNYIKRAFERNIGLRKVDELLTKEMMDVYAKRLSFAPNDFDIRCWVDKHTTTKSLNEIGSRCISPLSMKMPKKISHQKWNEYLQIISAKYPKNAQKFQNSLNRYDVFKQLGLDKYKTVDEGQTRFHITALGNKKDKNIELITAASFDRTYTNAGNSFRIPLKDILDDDNAEIIPVCDWDNGMQALSDHFAEYFTPPINYVKNENGTYTRSIDFSKIDSKDWLILMTAFAKGLNCRLPDVEKRFYEAFIEKSLNMQKIDEQRGRPVKDITSIMIDSLHAYIKNHLNYCEQTLALTFNACNSIQKFHQPTYDNIDRSRLFQAMRPYFIGLSDQNQSKLFSVFSKLMQALEKPNIPMNVLTSILEVVGFIHLNSEQQKCENPISFALTKSDGKPALQIKIENFCLNLPFKPNEAIQTVINYFNSQAAKNGEAKILESLFLELLTSSPFSSANDHGPLFLNSKYLELNLSQFDQYFQECFKSPSPFLQYFGILLEMARNNLIENPGAISAWLMKLPFIFWKQRDFTAQNYLLKALENFLNNPIYQLPKTQIQEIINALKDLLKQNSLTGEEFISKWILILSSTNSTNLAEISLKLLKTLQTGNVNKSLENLLFLSFLNNNHFEQAFNLFLLLQKKQGFSIEAEMDALLLICDKFRKQPESSQFVQINNDSLLKAIENHIGNLTANPSFSSKNMTAEGKESIISWMINYLLINEKIDSAYALLKLTTNKKIVTDSKIVPSLWMLLLQTYQKMDPSGDACMEIWKEANTLGLWKQCQYDSNYLELMTCLMQHENLQKTSFSTFAIFWKSLQWDKVPAKFKEILEKCYKKHLDIKISIEGESVLQELEKNRSLLPSQDFHLNFQLQSINQKVSEGKYEEAWANILKIKKGLKEPYDQLKMATKKLVDALKNNFNQKALLKILNDANIYQILPNEYEEIASCIFTYLQKLESDSSNAFNAEGYELLNIALDHLIATKYALLAPMTQAKLLRFINSGLKNFPIQKGFKDKVAQCQNQLFGQSPQKLLTNELCELLSGFNIHKITIQKFNIIIPKVLQEIKGILQSDSNPQNVGLAERVYSIAEKGGWLAKDNEIEQREICSLFARKFIAILQTDKAIEWTKREMLFNQNSGPQSINLVLDCVETFTNERKFEILPEFFKLIKLPIEAAFLQKSQQFFLDLIDILIENKRFTECSEILPCLYEIYSLQKGNFQEKIAAKTIEVIKHLNHENQSIEEASLALSLLDRFELHGHHLLFFKPMQTIFSSTDNALKMKAWEFIQKTSDLTGSKDFNSSRAECYLMAFQNFVENPSEKILDCIGKEYNHIFAGTSFESLKAYENVFLGSIKFLYEIKDRNKQIINAKKLKDYRQKISGLLKASQGERENIDIVLINYFNSCSNTDLAIESCALLKSLLTLEEISILPQVLEDTFTSTVSNFLKNKGKGNTDFSKTLIPLINQVVGWISPLTLLGLISQLKGQQFSLVLGRIIQGALNYARNPLSEKELEKIENLKKDAANVILNLINDPSKEALDLVQSCLNHPKISLLIGEDSMEIRGQLIKN